MMTRSIIKQTVAGVRHQFWETSAALQEPEAKAAVVEAASRRAAQWRDSMADRNDRSSGIDRERGPATQRVAGPERFTNVVAEFVDAARSAAESLLEEQKRQVADRVSGVAAALQSAANSLAHSQNALVARYVEQAAGQVEDISRMVRDRRWNEIAAETEDFARRRPTLFVVGAAAAGFLVGRLLWAATNGVRDRSGTTGLSSPSETTSDVTAAVSSSVGQVAGEVSGDQTLSSGTMETR
jgi:ElaB/YqjD/DUF883 family membrane-anchored ribosome-binding protein